MPVVPISVRSRRDMGAVETLCDEIRFPFTPEMETRAVLVSFVRVLYSEVHDIFGNYILDFR